MNYDSQDAFQERMKNEMRRMQEGLDGVMRTHANRNSRQEQPRVRTREGRPVLASVVEWVTWDRTVMLELTNEINIKILKTLSHAHRPPQELLL